VLYAHDIHLDYGGHAVLRNISLHLDEGEVLAVLGPSGVGKSSLLRVLAGLDKPARGEIRVLGKTRSQPHPRVGMVFQNAGLLPWLTLEKNVGLGLGFKRQPKIGRSARHNRIRDAIAEVDLSYATGYYPSQLSGGMTQRVALARALARQPRIVLLDEPFSGLDAATRANMQSLLKEVIEHHHSAAVLVTHDVDEALLLADRVLLLGGQPAGVVREWRLPAEPRHGAAPTEVVGARESIMDVLHKVRNSDFQRVEQKTLRVVGT
jgi:NitT/TauT family transport system ATP-binding protein